MTEQFDTTATLATVLLSSLFAVYQFLKRVRKNGKVNSLSEPEKRINYQEAYAELAEQHINLANDYRHDQERQQQAIEVLERTVADSTQQIEALSKQALEFKIAREALEARHDKELATQETRHAGEVDKLLDRMHKQTVEYTTQSLQQSALVTDLSTQLAEAKLSVNRLQDEIRELREKFEQQEAARIEMDKRREHCQEQIKQMQEQNSKLRADINILQRKLERSKDVPDTDDLSAGKKAA